MRVGPSPWVVENRPSELIWWHHWGWPKRQKRRPEGGTMRGWISCHHRTSEWLLWWRMFKNTFDRDRQRRPSRNGKTKNEIEVTSKSSESLGKDEVQETCTVKDRPYVWWTGTTNWFRRSPKLNTILGSLRKRLEGWITSVEHSRMLSD